SVVCRLLSAPPVTVVLPRILKSLIGSLNANVTSAVRVAMLTSLWSIETCTVGAAPVGGGAAVGGAAGARRMLLVPPAAWTRYRRTSLTPSAIGISIGG